MNRPIAPDLDDNPRIPASWSRDDLARELRAERRRCAEEMTENRQLRKAADALRELVDLKDLRTKIDGPQEAFADHDAFNAAAEDYYNRKAVAWGAARAALSPENVQIQGRGPETK